MKKIIKILIVMTILFLIRSVSFASEGTVNQTESKVLVNGELIEFEAYMIDGNNYFKLRDIAKVVSGTEKQFEVSWDNENHIINLISASPYTSVGGELVKGDGVSKSAISNKSSIYRDGLLIENLEAYTINGNNFFKLRDLTQEFNIGVGYNAATKLITVDTTIDYVSPTEVFEEVLVVDKTYDRVEAEEENTIIVGSARKDSITDDGGGEAIGYFQRKGDSITFKSCPSANSLTFRYANIMDITGVMLYIDGKKIDTLIFPNTQGYNAYKEITFNASIPENANVKIELGAEGALNIDYIDFNGINALDRDIIVSEEVEVSVPEVPSIELGSTRREAENTSKVAIYGNTSTESIPGGGTAISYFSTQDESITFKDSPSATALTFRYANVRDTTDVMLYVDGKKIDTLIFPATQHYTVYKEITFYANIPEHANVMVKLGDDCTLNIDYVDFSGVCTLARDIVSEEIEEGRIAVLNEDLANIPKVTRREVEHIHNVVIDGGNWRWGAAIIHLADYDDSIIFLDCPAANSIKIRYANTKDLGLTLYVDGKKNCKIYFPNSHGFYSYEDYEMSVDIPEGANVKIKVTNHCLSGINLDYIDFIYEEESLW